AEFVAVIGALGHVARGGLEHVEHAVEIGRKHPAPFFFGALDEGSPAAAADAGVRKAAVDAAEAVQRRPHGVRYGSRIGDVANAGIHLARSGRHGRGRRLVLLRIAAPDRNVAARGRKRLRNAKAYAAIATGNDGDAAAEIAPVHGALT